MTVIIYWRDGSADKWEEITSIVAATSAIPVTNLYRGKVMVQSAALYVKLEIT